MPLSTRPPATERFHALNAGVVAAVRQRSPMTSFTVNMSIADVVDDIEKVARCFDTPPVLIAHSMGAISLHSSTRRRTRSAHLYWADAGRAVERRRNTA